MAMTSRLFREVKHFRAGGKRASCFFLAAIERRWSQGGIASAWTQIFGMGAQIGNILPFSRNHELEADREGLRLMVRANYDPRAVVTFWRKMRSQSGSRQPEFLSTHPDSGRRVQQLEAEISAIESGA